MHSCCRARVHRSVVGRSVCAGAVRGIAGLGMCPDTLGFGRWGGLGMVRRLGFIGVLMLTLMGVIGVTPGAASAAGCSATGFNGLTAVLVNPSGTVSGDVNASGC